MTLVRGPTGAETGRGDAARSRRAVSSRSVDQPAATTLLERTGEGEPELMVALTEEQIAAADGYARRQFTASPWLDEHPEQRRFAAGVALRTLIAAEQIRLHDDEGATQWRAVPEIAGCLVLRRTAALFTTAERTVQTDLGPQVHRLNDYVHDAGVLEEEATARDVDRFTTLAPAQAATRLAAFAKPLVSDEAVGEVVRLPASGLPAHPLAMRLADTRVLSVLTMAALDPGAADPQLEFRGVDAAGLDALASVLVSRTG